MDPDPTPYDEAFFAAIHAESHASARAVIPRVLGLTGARSVVDVGCGTGAWSRACRDLGVPQVVGVDGAYVPAEHRGHVTEFIERDLAEPLDLGRSFALALCLEVAEHLPPERAPGLVADLTALAPVVLFSAAVPGQGGTGHVNEQWSEYWVALFDAQGWSCRDAIRPWVRANADVAWWYRQNLFLAVGPSVEPAYTSFPRLAAVRPEHPVDYIVRPVGDVMTPPAPPVPEPEPVAEPEPAADPEPAAWPGPEPVPERPTSGWPAAPDVPETPAAAAATNGEAATRAPESGPSAEDLTFPQPPGWAALRRIADRARRRSGR
jgi:SAM-dependent methyltransferase